MQGGLVTLLLADITFCTNLCIFILYIYILFWIGSFLPTFHPCTSDCMPHAFNAMMIDPDSFSGVYLLVRAGLVDIFQHQASVTLRTAELLPLQPTTSE